MMETHRPSRSPKPAIFGCAVVALLLIAVLAGCSLEPRATDDERARLAEAGRPYEAPIDKRSLAPLPEKPDWRDVLQRAFMANGDLEAAYFNWKAAVARVKIAGAYPNSNITLGYSYLFSSENMKAWDRTTLGVGFDPAMSLQWPTKVQAAARVALDEARAKGKRFEAAKFSLQQKVLTTWLDYAWLAERVRIQAENVDLLKMLVDTAEQRVRTGGPQQDMLKAQTEYEMASSELESLRSELQATRAMLNGLIGRSADDPMLPPDALPSPRPISADDARLIAVAVDNSPELAELAYEVAGRANALELARKAYIPDISPTFSITGSIEQMAGAMVTLPTNVLRIRGSIEEAEAMVWGAEAMARQARQERGASFVATLYALRNNERQVALFREVILPKAGQVLSSSQKAYSGGTISFAELIDSQRTFLEARRVLAEAQIARERRLAELETLAGIDVETLAAPATAVASPPATQSSTQTASE
jgi:outer membrane protein TolC